MYDLEQSASLTVPFFCHDESGDAVTGLTDGGFTKRISKNGGAFGAMTVTISEMENGFYSATLSTSHTDTLGLLTVVFTNASCKQVNLQWRVTTEITGNVIGSPAGASIAADIADTLAYTEIPDVADGLLARNIAGGSNGGRDVTSALRRLRNRVRVAAGTLYVYEEDDSSVDHQATVTTASGNPISEIDPTS